MNRKGVEHIEMIFSFIIFIGALAVAFTYFHPFSNSKTSNTLLDQIYMGVENRVSTDAIFVSLMINASQISTNNKFTLNISKELPSPWEVHAITNNGSILNSSIIDREIGEVEFDWKRSNSPFVTLIFAKEIVPTDKPLNVKQLGVNDSHPGVNNSQALRVVSVISRPLLSEKKIKELINGYMGSSVFTKQSLGVPPEISYGFQFVSPSGTLITDVPLERASDFRIKSKRIDILLANNTLEYGELGVGIW